MKVRVIAEDNMTARSSAGVNVLQKSEPSTSVIASSGSRPLTYWLKLPYTLHRHQGYTRVIMIINILNIITISNMMMMMISGGFSYGGFSYSYILRSYFDPSPPGSKCCLFRFVSFKLRKCRLEERTNESESHFMIG